MMLTSPKVAYCNPDSSPSQAARHTLPPEHTPSLVPGQLGQEKARTVLPLPQVEEAFVR